MQCGKSVYIQTRVCVCHDTEYSSIQVEANKLIKTVKSRYEEKLNSRDRKIVVKTYIHRDKFSHVFYIGEYTSATLYI